MQKVTLIGRLGKDAAIRETQDGGKFISFTLAVNSYVRGSEKTSWYDVVSFNYDKYRNMVKYFKKGSSLIVTGDLDADLEKGDDGKTRCRRYVAADSVEFLSNGSGGTKESRTEEEETPRRRRREEVAPDDISDEELEATTKPRRKPAPVEDEEDEPAVTKPRRKPAPVEDEEDEAPRKPRKRPEPEDDEDEEPAVSKPKRKPAPVEDDEDEAPRKPRKRSEPEDNGDEGDELPF